MIYSIIIEPIEMIVGWVYSFFINKFTFLGIIGAIYGVSMVINFLALPLYNVADSLQEKERKISKKLEYRVKRIKKGFRGDEQFMMLSEYYRQNDYHPLYVLRSSLSILIEIPFFIAAYHYLSNLESLNNTSYYFLDSLGAPDHLLSFAIGGIAVTINILPIIMTAINFISGYIYTRDATTRDKVQLYAMGIFFLVILYDSPSGLVFYWILNNIFSLCKTAALKTRHARKILIWAIGLNLTVFGVMYLMMVEKGTFGSALTVLGIAVIMMSFLKIRKPEIRIGEGRSHMAAVVISGTGLALLCGLLLPAMTIASSPIEFSYIGETASPVEYIKHGVYVFMGLFVFWPVCISRMFGKKVTAVTGCLMTVLLVTGLADAFIFTGNFGVMDSQFFPEQAILLKEYGVLDIIGPLVIMAATAVSYVMLDRKGKLSVMSYLMVSVCVAELVLGLMKTSDVRKGFSEYADAEKKTSDHSVPDSELDPVLHLSKNGKNVVVLFLDRAVGPFMPYALEEVPELRQQFSGFRYYPNTVSFSSYTVTSTPSMMAGYEYSPMKINERSDELLVDKHNEASAVMPLLFEKSGTFDISIIDPPLPNYKWAGDYVAFDVLKDPYINELCGDYTKQFVAENRMEFDTRPDNTTKKETVNYSIMRILHPTLRYGFNRYFRNVDGNLSANDMKYIDQFSSLYYLRSLTDFTDKENSFLFFGNCTTHEPTHLDEEFIFPSKKDISATLKYQPLDDTTLIHYETFIAAMKQVGLWLDFLRENNVYDNTRIIIVSDHGGKYVNVDSVLDEDKTWFTPLLMYKDFNCNGELLTDETFMTNADTIFLAKEGLGLGDRNPITGNELIMEKEEGINVFLSGWQAEEARQQKQKVFETESEIIWHVSPGDISREETWTRLEAME